MHAFYHAMLCLMINFRGFFNLAIFVHLWQLKPFASIHYAVRSLTIRSREIPKLRYVALMSDRYEIEQAVHVEKFRRESWLVFNYIITNETCLKYLIFNQHCACIWLSSVSCRDICKYVECYVLVEDWLMTAKMLSDRTPLNGHLVASKLYEISW